MLTDFIQLQLLRLRYEVIFEPVGRGFFVAVQQQKLCLNCLEIWKKIRRVLLRDVRIHLRKFFFGGRYLPHGEQNSGERYVHRKTQLRNGRRPKRGYSLQCIFLRFFQHILFKIQHRSQSSYSARKISLEHNSENLPRGFQVAFNISCKVRIVSMAAVNERHIFR